MGITNSLHSNKNVSKVRNSFEMLNMKTICLLIARQNTVYYMNRKKN